MRADNYSNHLKSLEEKRFAPTIPSEFVFDALEAYRHHGRDYKHLLDEVGLDIKQLSLPGNRVSVLDYTKLIERIITELDHGCVGFTDDRIPVKAFSVFATQLAACENVNQMIQQLNRFYGLFTTQFHLEITQDRTQARIILHYKETQDYDYRFIYQSILIMLVRMISWFVGVDLRCQQVRFTFDQSSLDKHLRYLFDSPLEFCCSHNEIRFDSEILTQPCSTTLDQVAAMLKDSRWMMLVNHKPAPFTGAVRKLLILNRHNEWLNIEDVAGSLNLSKNLLWRKLKKENTNFLDIRDEVKRDAALTLLNNHELCISDVALKTGFSDVSSFNKAFKKWTGQSPSNYRKSLTK